MQEESSFKDYESKYKDTIRLIWKIVGVAIEIFESRIGWAEKDELIRIIKARKDTYIVSFEMFDLDFDKYVEKVGEYLSNITKGGEHIDPHGGHKKQSKQICESDVELEKKYNEIKFPNSGDFGARSHMSVKETRLTELRVELDYLIPEMERNEIVLEKIIQDKAIKESKNPIRVLFGCCVALPLFILSLYAMFEDYICDPIHIIGFVIFIMLVGYAIRVGANYLKNNLAFHSE